MSETIPRGIRNDNPLNLRWSAKSPWNGQTGKDADGYCTFETPIYGLRAGAVLLLNYQDHHGCESVADMIERFAPPPKKAPKDRNPTAAYARFVAKRLEVGVNDPIAFAAYDTARPMLEAMVQFENGQNPYTDAQYAKALTMAGIEPPEKPLSESRTVRGVQIGGIGGVGLGSIGAVAEQIQDTVEPVSGLFTVLKSVLLTIKPYSGWLLAAALLAGLIGLAIVTYARWDDRKKGLR